MEPKRRRITGTVALAEIAKGSKSEHVGVVLRTAEGDEYVLRRRGGNAFQDDVLTGLVGTTIVGEGEVLDRNFIIDTYAVK